MKFNIFLYLGVLAAVFFSCATKSHAETINPANFKEIVKNPITILVDVRIPEEFSEKTAKGAVNIPLAKIEDNISFFKNQKSTVLFCNCIIQSEKAFEILIKIWDDNVYFCKFLDT